MRRLGALAVACAAIAVAPACRAQPPIWTVRGEHATIFLFGSVHLLPTGLEWIPQPLREALTQADSVWFELPIDAATDAQAVGAMRMRGYFPAGDGLSAHLTEEQYERLKRAAGAVGAQMPVLERMRPWLAEMTLSLMSDAREGALVSQGVERRIQNMAPPTARRQAFESASQQIALLTKAPLGDQIAALDETAMQIEKDPDAYRRIVQEWLAGDLAAVDADALQPLRRASPRLYKRLITDRNATWATAIEGRARSRGVSVVVVGLGHLIGPDGVPALLRARGLCVGGP